MAKRKRSAIRKARQAIVAEADRLQKSTGISFGHRNTVVGGARPKLVDKIRDERGSDRDEPSNIR